MKIVIELTDERVKLHSDTVFEKRLVNILGKVDGVGYAVLVGRYSLNCKKAALFGRDEVMANIKAALSKEYENVKFEVLPEESPVFTQKIDNRNGDAC